MEKTRSELLDILKHCSFWQAFESHFNSDYFDDTDDMIENGVIRDWITDAFTWRDTDEGHCYWEDIHRHWQSYCDDDYLNVYEHLGEWYSEEEKKPKRRAKKKGEKPEDGISKTFSISMARREKVKLNFVV